MAQKYLIAVDMDGTLLNSQGKMTQKTAGILQDLLDAGHYVVPASGRALPLLPKEITSLSGLSYGILENGAVLWDWKKKKALDTKFLPEDVAEQILRKVKEQYERETADYKKACHYYTEVIADGRVYAEKNDVAFYETAAIPGNFTEYMLANHEYLAEIHEQKELLQRAEKVNLYFEDTSFAEKIRAQWKNVPGICVTTSVAGNAEFMAEGVNKGLGIAALKELLGIKKEHIIAIGDNENDVEMFGQAGISVAMGNASDTVKQCADFVAADNNHDGAALFLQDFFQKKIVFSDVDGTLLNSEHKITPLTVQAIKTLKEKDIPFVIISARSPSGIYPILKEYNFSCPIISYSGSLILDENRNVLYHHGMKKEAAAEIITFLEKQNYDMTYSIYSLDQWIAKNTADARIIREENIVKAKAMQGTLDDVTDDEVNKILCICNPEQTLQIEEALKQAFPQYSIVKSSDILIEIMENGITKAAAVEKLCEILKISTENAVAFGDNYNDVEMLEAAGCGFLMGNAPEPLKARIQNHTDDNNHDGIYHALKKLDMI